MSAVEAQITSSPATPTHLNLLPVPVDLLLADGDVVPGVGDDLGHWFRFQVAGLQSGQCFPSHVSPGVGCLVQEDGVV